MVSYLLYLRKSLLRLYIGLQPLRLFYSFITIFLDYYGKITGQFSFTNVLTSYTPEFRMNYGTFLNSRKYISQSLYSPVWRPHSILTSPVSYLVLRLFWSISPGTKGTLIVNWTNLNLPTFYSSRLQLPSSERYTPIFVMTWSLTSLNLKRYIYNQQYNDLSSFRPLLFRWFILREI